jgi:hypothetical protein
MTSHSLINWIGAISALIAAGCWFYSATIQVPDNIDTFVRELNRIGYWNAWAARASCVAAFFTFLSLGFGALRP